MGVRRGRGILLDPIDWLLESTPSSTCIAVQDFTPGAEIRGNEQNRGHSREVAGVPRGWLDAERRWLPESVAQPALVLVLVLVLVQRILAPFALAEGAAAAAVAACDVLASGVMGIMGVMGAVR